MLHSAVGREVNLKQGAAKNSGSDAALLDNHPTEQVCYRGFWKISYLDHVCT